MKKTFFIFLLATLATTTYGQLQKNSVGLDLVPILQNMVHSDSLIPYGITYRTVIAYDYYGVVSSLCLNKSYTLKVVPEDECVTLSEWTFSGHDFPMLGYPSGTTVSFSALNETLRSLRLRDFLGWYQGSGRSIALQDCGEGITVSPNPVGGVGGGGVNINCPTCDKMQPLPPRELRLRGNVTASATLYEVQVRNRMGALLLNGTVAMSENGETTFDLSSLPNGVYLLTLLQNGVPVGS